jgi:hypothetical protein
MLDERLPSALAMRDANTLIAFREGKCIPAG